MTQSGDFVLSCVLKFCIPSGTFDSKKYSTRQGCRKIWANFEKITLNFEQILLNF